MQSCTTPVLLAVALLSASVGALAKEGGDQSANGPESFLDGALPPPGTYLLNYLGHYGGKLKDSIGIPEEWLREAAKSAVCKINIDSDGRLAMTAAVREVFANQPAEFDPRKYLGPARESLKKLYMHKTEKVLGSAGKA